MSKEKKQDKAVKQVYETADLSKFKQLKGNRPVKISKALRDSIAKRGVLTEIKVNRKMEVIDGQHRLAVARELGLPITYTFDDSDIDVAELNSTSKSWKVEDYIHKYAESGYQSYKQLLNLMSTYPALRVSSTISTALGYSSTAGRKQMLYVMVRSVSVTIKNMSSLLSHIKSLLIQQILGQTHSCREFISCCIR